jgi:hypothetical protein
MSLSTFMLPAIEGAALRALESEWYEARGLLGVGDWKRPTLCFFDAKEKKMSKLWGCWSVEDRTIYLNDLLLWMGWGAVRETLRHEMAHQYVDEVLNVKTDNDHGPHFAKACQLLRIDCQACHSAAEKFKAADGYASHHDRTIRRIRKLLCLADRGTAHEAEAAMMKANELLLRYNIKSIEAPERRKMSIRHLGVPSEPIRPEMKAMSNLLSGYCFVRCIHIRTYNWLTQEWGYVLEIMGTEENIDLAAYTYDQLYMEAEKLWEQHRKLTGERKRNKAAFVTGVYSGYAEKLGIDRARLKKEDRTLVWIGDPQLEEYFKDRYPSTTSIAASRITGNSSYLVGRAKGRDVTIARAMRSSHGNRGHRLPGGEQ